MDYRRLSFFLLLLTIGTIIHHTLLNDKYGADNCERQFQSSTSIRLFQENTELQDSVKQLEGESEKIKNEISSLKKENGGMESEISGLKAQIKNFRDSDMTNSIKKADSDTDSSSEISELKANLLICEEAKIYEENKRKEAQKKPMVCDEAKICEKVCEESLKRIEIADARVRTMNSQMMGLVHDIHVCKRKPKVSSAEKVVHASEKQTEHSEVESFPDVESVKVNDVEPENTQTNYDTLIELDENSPKEAEKEAKVPANLEFLIPESILKMSKKLQQDSFDHPRILNEDTSDHTHAERFKTEIGKRQPENNKWIILGFASTSYLFSAKMWYHQLSSIGYTEHVIVALDRKVYDELTYNNTLDDHNYYRVLPSGPTGRYLDEPTRAMEGPGYRVWKSERQGENLKK